MVGQWKKGRRATGLNRQLRHIFREDRHERVPGLVRMVRMALMRRLSRALVSMMMQTQ
jgi:hypothetical protein